MICKRVLLQILQIPCKKVVYVPADKWQNRRTTVIVTLTSYETATLEYLYMFRQFRIMFFKKIIIG